VAQHRSWLAIVAIISTSIVLSGRVFTQERPTAAAPALTCDMQQYKPMTGLTAGIQGGLLAVTWAGSDGAEVRARYAIDSGEPIVRDLAVRKTGGQWAILGENLKPQYDVVSGIRRFSSQQGEPLEAIGMLTPERAEKEKWYAYRDAPLYIPGAAPAGGGRAGRGARGRDGGDGEAPAGGRGRRGGGAGRGTAAPGAPAFVYTSPKPEDIKRASSTFHTTSCSVKTDGARIEVAFNGLSMGIFSGSLQFTAYKGTNLIRMDAIAQTSEPSVAYKYDAGLSGFSTGNLSRLVWNDVGGHATQYQFGGLKNDKPVPVKAQNRVIIAQGRGGSLAAFPMPHAFFWPRQVEFNHGYLWYRKDGDSTFSMGIRQSEQEVESDATTWELYNAPPGSLQHMGVYFYASPLGAESTRQAVLAFTHNDTYKPVAGYKTMVNHLHLGMTSRLKASGSLDGDIRDMAAVKALGVNIVGDSEFHGDPLRSDSGAGRFPDQADYGTVTAKLSDKDFLVTPWEEPSAYFGGHYNIFWPKVVLWSKTREASQTFASTDPKFGKVYHVGDAKEMQQLLDAEGGYWYHAHPRTKGTAGYPDAIWDRDYVKNDRYLGVAYKMGMGIDLSEIRTCEWRCFDSIDTMNNMNTGTGLRPKLLIADIDSYQKGPEDDLYPTFPVTYLKLDRVPGPTDDWSPILKAMRDGNMFVTTGEILIKSYAVEGTGNQRTINAELEWTFPLEFVEVTVGDGKKVERQTIRTTELAPNSSKRFTIPVNATGKSWVRFAAYDSAGNPAFAQPQWFNPANK
jgi:hypothetical protein